MQVAMRMQRQMRKARTEVVILGESSDHAFGASKGQGNWYSSVGDDAFLSSFKGCLISVTQGQCQNAPATFLSRGFSLGNSFLETMARAMVRQRVGGVS